MFTTLLVALDGGPQHARVLDLAAAIAGPHSRLHLLCVLDPEFALAADASEPIAPSIRKPPASAPAPRQYWPKPWPNCASAVSMPSRRSPPAIPAKSSASRPGA